VGDEENAILLPIMTAMSDEPYERVPIKTPEPITAKPPSLTSPTKTVDVNVKKVLETMKGFGYDIENILKTGSYGEELAGIFDIGTELIKDISDVETPKSYVVIGAEIKTDLQVYGSNEIIDVSDIQEQIELKAKILDPSKMSFEEKNRRYGKVIAVNKSNTRAGVEYEVRMKDDKLTCNCPGYVHRKKCRHVEQYGVNPKKYDYKFMGLKAAMENTFITTASPDYLDSIAYMYNPGKITIPKHSVIITNIGGEKE